MEEERIQENNNSLPEFQKEEVVNKKPEFEEVPEESVAIPKKSIILFPTVILLVLISIFAGYLLFQNYQLKNSLKITDFTTCASDTSSVIQESYPRACVTKDGRRFTEKASPLSPTDPTADWETYNNDIIEISLKYPNTWTYKEYDETKKSVDFSSNIPHHITTEGSNNYIVNVQLENTENYKQWSTNSLTKSLGTETINNYVFERYAVPDMNWALNYIYKSPNGEIVRIYAWPYDDEANFNRDFEPTFRQVLSTFRFTNSEAPITTPKPNTPTLKYSLPQGWETLKDKNNKYEISFDPSSMKASTELSSNGIVITRYQNSTIGYSFYFGVSLINYNGSSRHQFIYDGIGATPTKDEYSSSYKEVEYTYNGRSCLFLDGIYVSQIPSTWGMCDAGGGKAFLITSWELDTKIVQTLKLL